MIMEPPINLMTVSCSAQWSLAGEASAVRPAIIGKAVNYSYVQAPDDPGVFSP
jgi:hypothetical protein